MFHSLISRFLVYANIVVMLSNGEYFDAALNEQHDLGLFEGDIMLTEAQRRFIMSGDVTSYSGIEGGQWPDGIIPYEIVDSSNSVNKTDHNNPENSFIFADFDPRARQVILDAIERFHASTCLRFVERKYYHQYYIKIVDKRAQNKTTLQWDVMDGCYSWIGIEYGSKNIGQVVNMAPSCFIQEDKLPKHELKIGT